MLRQGTEQHIGDTTLLIEAGQADGTIREEDAALLALGVVGAVGHYSHFSRTGRITMPLPDLADFVARWVVHSVAADEQCARDALRPPALTA